MPGRPLVVRASLAVTSPWTLLVGAWGGHAGHHANIHAAVAVRP